MMTSSLKMKIGDPLDRSNAHGPHAEPQVCVIRVTKISGLTGVFVAYMGNLLFVEPMHRLQYITQHFPKHKFPVHAMQYVHMHLSLCVILASCRIISSIFRICDLYIYQVNKDYTKTTYTKLTWNI